ncbi:hypothetical protein FDECE_12051 [Fusarium decemcellulare]|nr:hypothetical protein FDECE_12051 [Fusarium decemcellulare]
MCLGPIFTLVACAVRVAANSGEDFSNNLFSDLAPLLALFGERVTMQFMSQSMGWADNIILAMAPIGIITVIVSAIRVGGPSWLKALIGRARENIAVAEADLMSSTSNEVCELWNGHHVVRCMGSAPILEFICLVPKYGDRKNVREVRVISLDEALDKGHVKKIKKSFSDRFRQIHGLAMEHENYPKLEQGESNDSSSEIIIVHNQRDASPNVSLNCHGQICRGELHLVAICATLLQSAVLVYSGFVACRLTVPEDEYVAKGYAFPCTFIGMLVLVSGLLICGHVVESSTEKDRYYPGQGTAARLVWLQQPMTVSDQVFDSYVIFPRHARSIITTSTRKDKAKLSQVANSASSQDGRDKPPDKNRRLSMFLETKAFVGVVISLCGFIVQFVGLRGMHWSVSVAQLGAILTMAALRALVRRGLAMPPEDKLLDPGFELEWFSLTQIDPGKIWWPSSEADAKESEVSGNWRVMTAGSSDIHSPLWRETKVPRPEHSKHRSKAHQAMIIRKELGQFVTWPAVASIEAAALARAIEITMDALIGPSRADIWYWSLKTHHVDRGGQSEVHFSLRKGELESLTRELEAALSLWLFSVNQYEKGQGLDGSHNRTPGIPSRSKGPPQNSSLRLLGRHDKSLHRDLDWWMPHDATRILRAQQLDSVRNTQNHDSDDNQKVLEVPNHRIVGCGSRENCAPPELSGQARYQSSPLSKLYLIEKTETLPRADDLLRAYLAVESSTPLKLLYAQDMFTAFMWSVAKTMLSCIPGSSDLVHNDQGKKGEWKSFRFRHEELSRMVQDISNTGLGSLDQIYLSVIPPLSAENKLPETTKIIKLAQKQVRRPQEKQDWMKDSKPYLWLFETAQTFPKDSAVSVRTMAAFLEYANIMRQALDLREPIYVSSESDDEGEAEGPLLKAKMIIEDNIKEWLGPGEDLKTRTIFSYLRTLYEEQGRKWRWETAQEPKAVPESVAEYPQAFGFSELHRLYQKPSRLISRGIRAALNRVQSMDQQDVFNWTPLHYAAAKGNAGAARRLLEYEADVNARDLIDWTPLHYACQRGNTTVVEELLLAQADLNLCGIDGVTPLHCAAMSGCIDAATSLIKARATADATDNAGNTWLHWAAFHGHTKFMIELKPQVDINLRNHNGRSPLHLASVNGHKAVVRTLAGNGADIGAEDDANQTPLHLAAAKGHEAVVEVLVERGARIDVRNRRGETPLDLAAKRGHRVVTEYLGL